MSVGPRWLVPCVLVAVVSGCSAADSSSVSALESSGPAGTDDEAIVAEPPQEIAGSFLIGCERVREAPEGFAVEGEEVYGCFVIDARTGARVAQPVDEVLVTIDLGAGGRLVPPQMAGAGPWHVYIRVAQNMLPQVARVEVTARVGGQPVAGVGGPIIEMPRAGGIPGFDPGTALKVPLVPDPSPPEDPLELPVPVRPDTYLFVTSKAFQGVDAATAVQADDHCVNMAKSLGFVKVAGVVGWRALLSQSSRNKLPASAMRDILNGPQRVLNVKGLTVAPSADLLWSQGFRLANVLDEEGRAPPDLVRVWTYSDAKGFPAGGSCVNDGTGAVGLLGGSGSDWLSAGFQICYDPDVAVVARLYCVSISSP